jgi:hypothetical protein
MQSVRDSAQGIDDIFTEVATLPSSIAPRSVAAWPDILEGTIVPGDSISLAGSASAEHSISRRRLPGTVSRKKSDPSEPMLDSAKSFNARYANFFLNR